MLISFISVGIINAKTNAFHTVFIGLVVILLNVFQRSLPNVYNTLGSLRTYYGNAEDNVD